MATETEQIGRPIKIAITVDKYRESDSSYHVVEIDDPVWFDVDGSEITDPARIAELDAGVAQRQEGRQ